MDHDTKIMRTVSAVCAGAVLALGAAACGDDTTSSGGSASAKSGSGGLSGQIAGAGSSAQEAAQEAWRSAFQQSNSGATVSYDPVGSGGGVEQFTGGGVPFAGSDSPLTADQIPAAQKQCGGADNLIEIPVYVSPIAVAYNLDGVDQPLKLTPDTLAKIFKGDIAKWDDPAIKADNPGVDLPGDDITVVHRSDESGTTANFTDYLSQAAPSVWSYEVSGDWPAKGGEAAEGTSGVVSAIKGGSGTIGYADASQVGDLQKAEVKVGSAFVGPSAEAAAKIFDAFKETKDPGKYVATYELERTTTKSGTYPIVLASYELACTKYGDAGTAKLVKAYLTYVTSEEGQQAAAKAAGSAPTPMSVAGKNQKAVKAITAGA
jgi:phosphate transport system substrate-binding protein